MNKVLMIAYYYPPVAGGGVQRTSKFAKYLPQFGWKPVVLTVREAFDYYSDDSLLQDIDGSVTVHRSGSIEPMKWIRKRLKQQSQNPGNSKDENTSQKIRLKKFPWLLKIKESIFIPDAEIGWLPFAVIKALKLIKKENIDLIYSTSCPYTDHLIAYFLKKITGKPWVADFRDPWSLSIKAPQFSWRRFWDIRLERRILGTANRVVTVTKPIERDFRRICPQGRYKTITNGYDEDDFCSARTNAFKEDRFTITYTGILFRENSPNTFLKALANLIAEKPDLREKILVRFVGQIDNPGESDNLQYLQSLPLDSVVQLVPYVRHRQAIEYMISSDVVLLIVNDGPHRDGIITSKSFEYARSGSPVLAVVPPDGAAGQLVLQTHSGIVVHPDAIDEIRKAIHHLYKLYQRKSLDRAFKRRNLSDFNRLELTRSLAGIFDELVSV
jgi:glycosyltransferase involved in cell wall biosynthesis